MKRLFATTLLCAAAAPALFAGISDQDMNRALQEIRRRNTPRYCVYNHQDIVDQFLGFAKTNDLTYLQKVEFDRRLADSASEIADKTAYSNAVAGIRACTNTRVRVSTMRSLISGFSGLYSSENQWRLAMDEFDADPALFDTATRMDMNNLFATSYARMCDADGFARRFRMIEEEPPAKAGDEADPKSAYYRSRARAILGAVNACLPFRQDEAKKLFARHRALFTQAQVDDFYKNLARACADAGDRAGFDEVLAMVAAYPVEKRVEPYRELLSQMHRFDKKTARRLIDEALADKTLKPAWRAAYLSTKQGFYSPQVFNYGFNVPGEYETYRSVIRERIALMKANRDDKGCDFAGDRWFRGILDVVIWFDDLPFADELVEIKLERYPGDRDTLQRQAQIRAIRGDAAGAVKSLEAVLATERCPAAVTNDTLPVVAFLKGRGLRGFDEAVAPLGLDSAKRLRALRKTSLELFKMRRYDDCRAIVAEIYGHMYLREPVRACTATYVPNAPTSADGFVRSPFHDDWKAMYSAFGVYGDGYSESGETDERRHLKDAVQPVPDPALRTGVRVLYDELGVHVFVRCDDPGVDDIRLGRRDAGSLEICFRPGGEDKPYHTIFFSGLPSTDDPHLVDWSMPGRHYRRTQDCFAKDATLTDKGCVAHVSIPWMSFYDSLPSDGNDWTLGVIRWTDKGGLTSGGVVHELSRGIKIRFQMTPAQIAGLRRNVSITAFNRYDKIRRDKGGVIQSWNDPLLGDPAFYEAEVAPLVEELDAAGKRLLAPAPDKEVEQLYRDVVPLWAEIRYELAERRARYLGDRLFEEK